LSPGVDIAARLEALTWTDERSAALGDLAFRLPSLSSAGEDGGEADSFALLKDRPIIQAYVDYWRGRPPTAAENVFEIGLWDGGSIALWHEILKPRTHVGVDLEDRRSGYFERYLAAADRGKGIHTYWDVDQADKGRLAEIVARHFSGPLDLVLDDGSHLYGPTRASMEVLFPLLRPGGLYVVEDWAWGHWGEEFRLHASPEREGLTRLVGEIAGIVGSSQEFVASLDVRRPFFVVQRGHDPSRDPIDLDAIRSWRSPGLGDSRAAWLVRRYAGAARRRLGRTGA
jgi:SAM-dependent methyltransferase